MTTRTNINIFLFLLSLYSLDVYAAEIRLQFSNDWVIKLDDGNFANYDYSGPGDNVRVHHNHRLDYFDGAIRPEDRGNSIYLTGVFKHTVKKYSHRGDLSVIQFTMTSRELVNNQLKVFRQDQILFETKKKPFSDMKSVSQALIETIGKKDIYKAIEVVKNKEIPEQDKRTESPVKLISMSIDGIKPEREKTMSESFFELFNTN